MFGFNIGDIFRGILNSKTFYAIVLWIIVTFVVGLGSITYPYLLGIASIIPAQIIYAFCIVLDIFVYYIIVYIIFILYQLAQWVMEKWG